ncbi:SRPBCC family protein [Antarctobacter jejuensis]|uniref:SRPBCC family protein n=1 Tax=Antarctobacter jejuensis TaxID=1439938 RepID=UPI003FD16597
MDTFDIDTSAPAIGRADIAIDAPIRAVWSVLADLADWPEWNSGVDWISNRVPAQRGTCFEWRAGGLTLQSRLEAVSEPYLLGWSTSGPLFKARHVILLDDRRPVTRVRADTSFRGTYPGLLPGHARRRIEHHLTQTLADLKGVCEGKRPMRRAA